MRDWKRSTNLFIFIFFSCVLLEFAKKKDVTPLMGERSRAIVRLVQPRIFSTSDVILCNFINTTSPLILNFSSDQKYFFLYRATPFFPAFAFMILSSIVSSPRLYLSLFSAKFWENCKHLLNSTLKKENNNYARYKSFKKTFVLKKTWVLYVVSIFSIEIDRKMLNLKYFTFVLLFNI